MADWLQIFGGDLPHQSLTPLQVAARTGLLFFLGLVAIRLGKSRLLARATGVDVLVGVILGSILARGMLGSSSLSNTIVSSVVLIAIHAALTRAAYYSYTLGDLIKGHARPLVKDGEILWDNLRRSHISEHDLVEALRLQVQVEDPAQIRVAYKERNGEISAIPKKDSPQLVQLGIADGVQVPRIESS